jgi:hypothetical protein
MEGRELGSKQRRRGGRKERRKEERMVGRRKEGRKKGRKNRLQEVLTVIGTLIPLSGGGWVAGHRLPKGPMSYKILWGNP